MLTFTSLLPVLLVASANGQNGNFWGVYGQDGTGSYSNSYGGNQPQQAWQPRTFSLPEPVARPQPVAEAQVSVDASGYQHDNTGDDGYSYVHDTRGDFGPYKAWLARKKQQAAVQPAAPVQQAVPVVQKARPAVQKVRKLVQKARPVVQKARPVVQQSKFSNFQAQPARRVVEQTRAVVQKIRPVVQQTRPAVQQAAPVAAPVAASYEHDSTGDSGYAYVHDTRGDFGPYRAFLARQKQQKVAEPIIQQAKPIVQQPRPVVQQARPVVQQPKPVVQQFSGPAQPAAPAFQQAELGPATHSPLRYAGHTNAFVDYVNRFSSRAYDYAAPLYSAQAEGNSYTYSASF